MAIGNATYANQQSTALGSNALAAGTSSIAIGNDDITAYSDQYTAAVLNKIKDKLKAIGDLRGETAKLHEFFGG
ncbi:hypothetical protein GVX81_06845 [[Haemophilus] felis]|uniref:Trimeric autotransporter adhesin YadA-like head domain-containing protein n=1 Tax=[Haemophilus] felis TaxID=123822 RepID=A0A1T0B685_9PAST|nr:hypothetical protein [[Haemophilus] felis]NBI40821.1 hypothetical protein [[Haemophilus] felis]OOS05526.1 hypothetical protein B0188_03705 [[Haemophilus] felis]